MDLEQASGASAFHSLPHNNNNANAMANPVAEEAAQPRVIPLDDTNKTSSLCCWSFTRRSICIIVMSFLVIGAVVGVALAILFKKTDSIDSPTGGSSNMDYEQRYMSFRSSLTKTLDSSSLMNLDSPQSQALEWMVYKDKLVAVAEEDGTMTEPMERKLIQRYAVIVLLFALRGAAWQNDALETPLHEVDECEYEGISCGNQGMIARLEWPSQKLAGALPVEIALLTALEYLDLDSNYVEGPIPEQLYELTSLRTLLLQSNEFSSTISASIRNLASLEELSLNENYLTGELPKEMASMTLLKQLELNNNRFTGEVFDILVQLSMLETIDLDKTSFTGTIPESIGQLTNLTWLTLQNVAFDGSLPDSLVQLTTLVTFSLSAPGLTGSFPSLIGQLTNLGSILVSTTNLIGTLPKEIGQLTALSKLTIQGAALSGTLPSELGQLTQLVEMTLEDNHFWGTIPSEIRNLKLLKEFNVRTNAFTGDLNFICEVPYASYYYPCTVSCDCCYKTCGDYAQTSSPGSSPSASPQGISNGTRAF